MDLYVGIFNSKLYASTRGSARVNAVDKRSRNGFNSPSAILENVCEDDRNSFQSGSFSDFKNKPPVLSNCTGSNRQLTSISNVGYTKLEMRSPSTDGADGAHLEKSLAPNVFARKTSNPQIDAVPGVKSLQADVGDNAGHFGKERKTVVNNVGHVVHDKSETNINVASLSNVKSREINDVVAGIGDKAIVVDNVSTGQESPDAETGDCGKAMGSSEAALHLPREKKYETRQINKDLRHEANQTKMGNESLPQECFSSTQQRSDKTTVQEHSVDGSRVRHNLAPEHGENDSNIMKKDTSTRSVPIKHVKQGHVEDKGYNSKWQKSQVAIGSSLLHRAGLTKPGKAGDIFAARRPFSSSEFHRYESKNTSMALSVSTSEVEGMPQSLFQPEHMTRRREVGDFYTSKFQVQEHNVGALQSRGQGSSDMGDMPGERATVLSRRGTAGEVESVANELALKDSPIGAHTLVANLRVGGSASADSSSSHGGSSHSGSPTAAENHRDSRVSSFGNIMLSKGSPRSVSSRSMGSASISGHGSFTPSKSSFIDSPASQFRYITSSGRKSAELVPNRRYSEIIPNRKSTEMMTNGHSRGVGMQGLEGNGPLGSANSSIGTGNLGNGGNISLSNGNLLVGSANGNVKSVGGATKSHLKQGDVANHSTVVDYTLLKKAQASSDPQEVKNAGNEYYRRGLFSEALTLYTKAVSLLPSNAAYRSNRAAALTAIGRLGEAVKECEDAISLDSSYACAHQRAVSLYLRLGLMERAKQHLQATGQQTDILELQRLRTIDEHISKCLGARKRCEWQTVIRESDAAVVAGADSAPQIFGYKSEALLGLHRPDEADSVCTAAQRVESSLIKSGVILADPFLLIVRAQVDMALGRFEGAIEAAKSAAKIDPRNEIISALLRKAQAVCHTRTTGNELFKAGRFFEALALYAEGLESDPMNAVLLCNRAACRSKLGQWEKAVEDCDAALRIQPNYTKAIMRRANCWTKLERWEDALQDYELLRRKMPEDLEVARGLFDVQVAMKKLQGEDTHKMKFGGDVEEVLSDEHFQEAISSPGLSLVQFVTKWSERCRQFAPFVDDLCRRNPCVNFLRVNVEENPYLAKFECVSFIPTFKIYKSGQKVKEILGPTEQSLEYALRHYTM
ncbi:hypothetical protein GOP47_0021830 [Adiantum capillus-veneris]|uniref:Thioredoxin domain-containing protein n=1 Tax=Adiantum capillus-veneris TaxID=13818 RepID=A0A9D4U888_ADICA|nr:hypothetical protein GOP47_0021830 [Adiantum capillus-veneris]